MKLKLFSKIIVFKSLGKTLWNAVQLDLGEVLAVALKQLDHILADCQNIETLFVGDQAKQGFDIETVRYNQQLIGIERQLVVTKHFYGKEHGNAIALAPEEVVQQEPLSRI